MEEHEKVLIDPSLEGKTKEQLGLKPFTCTEVRSNIMGIPVTITEEIIARAIRRAAEGSYEEGLDKTSPWNDVVNMTMFNNTKKGKYSDLRMEYKMLHKIMTEDLLHFLINKEKTNVPKYIFNHIMWALKKNQNTNRSWIPYGRLLSEIFHPGGILKAL